MESCSSSKYIYALICITFLLKLSIFPSAVSEYTPQFVWSAVNKSLEEDRLQIVDANNEKVRIKGCVRVALYNHGSEQYIHSNHSGDGYVFVNATFDNFSTQQVMEEVKTRINQINHGTCVPCIVIISLVNVSSTQQEKFYRDVLPQHLHTKTLDNDLKQIEDYKLAVSNQFTKLLQYKTPIQARHLILVRIVQKTDELTKCHGKKYTRYPRRLVSIWEQVLFDHFREARVIQGALETSPEGNPNKMLMSGKESGIWVWMCEEIIQRLELQESCELYQNPTERDRCIKDYANMTTAKVDMADLQQCGMYRARS